jgi:murein L,D-transpeptidase YafK
VRTPDPNTVATQAAVNVEPAPAPPSQGPADVAVPTVAVQQFGETPEADESSDTTTQPIAQTGRATEVIPQPLGTEAQADATADAAANATTQQPPTAANTPQNVIPVPAPPASPAAAATIAEGLVTGWTNAWQSQDVAGYLAFYHPEFSPPNQASIESWQNSRRRIITSQSSISITVDDFRVVDNSGNQITVQFLLTYRGDTYADRTVKQLVLQPDAGGELCILREENLQTEVFDPVIEDASSWMTDITPDSTAATEDRNYEPVASQLALDEPFPLAGNTTNAGTPAPTAAQQHRDDATLLAASATEIPVSRQPVATDAPVIGSPGLQAPATATIPLIFNLTTLSPDEVQQINNFLMQWALAWQTQDTDLYFAHYHPDYKAPESATVTAWREERIGKITTPASINITLSELEILENNDGNILIELLMEYHADGYGDRTTKRMLLSKSTAAAWLITMEKNLQVETLQ